MLIVCLLYVEFASSPSELFGASDKANQAGYLCTREIKGLNPQRSLLCLNDGVFVEADV